MTYTVEMDLGAKRELWVAQGTYDAAVNAIDHARRIAEDNTHRVRVVNSEGKQVAGFYPATRGNA